VRSSVNTFDISILEDCTESTYRVQLQSYRRLTFKSTTPKKASSTGGTRGRLGEIGPHSSEPGILIILYTEDITLSKFMASYIHTSIMTWVVDIVSTRNLAQTPMFYSVRRPETRFLRRCLAQQKKKKRKKGSALALQSIPNNMAVMPRNSPNAFVAICSVAHYQASGSSVAKLARWAVWLYRPTLQYA